MKLVSLSRIAVVSGLVLILLMVSTASISADSPSSRINESVQTLREMSREPDAGTMAALLNNAHGVAIFPSVLKAGIFLGGRYGEGLVLQHDPETGTWYGPNFVTIKGISYGIQFGVQSTALVLVINNERGMEGFKGTQKFTLGGDLSVSAGPLGRHAEAGTDVELEAAIYSYSMSKGIFAGLSLEGAMIEVDEDANERYWGLAQSPGKILSIKAEDSRIEPLIKELEKLITRAK